MTEDQKIVHLALLEAYGALTKVTLSIHKAKDRKALDAKDIIMESITMYENIMTDEDWLRLRQER